MNIDSVLPQTQSQQETIEYPEFVGVISLQSTTISDFYNGLMGGYNSIINLDKSSIINVRGAAIKLIHPRFFKITSSVIQKTEEEGIEIKLIQPKSIKKANGIFSREKDIIESSKSFQRRIIIQSNRLIGIRSYPVKVSQFSYELFREISMNAILADSSLMKGSNVNDHNLIQLNCTLRIHNNKIYSATKDCLYLRNLHLRQIEISKNDILKNVSSGIHLFNVRCHMNDPKKLAIRNNSISESFQGHGIHIENSTVYIEHNELRKNQSDGICITTNSNLMQTDQNTLEFAPIIEIQSTISSENSGSGISILDFEGMVDI
jgi:hypothetical protein